MATPINIRRRHAMTHLALLTLTLVASTPMYAQSAVATTGLSGLAFGSIPRSGSITIAYDGTGAARFSVTGDADYAVRLTVSVDDLTTNSGASMHGSDRTIAVNVTNSDCAFSLDNGASWTNFTSGLLYHDTEFPGGKDRTTILVRVGASIDAGATQQRGNYTGNVTLIATYL